ncbi:MAG: DUF2064 domain-containing protein [Bdellovibrionota bacterium]
MNKLGLAIFVKTPELSPVKTRLAKDIGQEKALRAYEWCLKTVEETYKALQSMLPQSLDVYWAVAEKEALNCNRWRGFPNIYQGEGALGDRLHTVTSVLTKKYQNFVVVGADTPILPLSLVTHSLEFLLNTPNSYVLGPAEDGGFYLFGANIKVPDNFWNSLTYSQSQTANDLVALLPNGLNKNYLPQMWDLDTVETYEKLLFENESFREWMDC